MSGGPTVTPQPDGGLRIGNLSPWFTQTLLELDELLDPNQPEKVKRRLYPMPSDDETQREDWERLVHPDLRALVASAREIVNEDLKGLQAGLGLPRRKTAEEIAEDEADGEEDDGGWVAQVGWHLDVPANHVQAWISALQTARLTLAELHGVGERESRELDIDPEDPVSMAIARMQTYAWLLELILERVDPELRSD